MLSLCDVDNIATRLCFFAKPIAVKFVALNYDMILCECFPFLSLESFLECGALLYIHYNYIP